MSAVFEEPPATPWPRAAAGGAIGALVSVAIVLTLGVVAFTPMGVQAAALGVPAAFATVIVSAAVFAALSRNVIPAGGPTSATALIVAAGAARFAQEEPAADGVTAAFSVIVCLGAAVSLMGLMQLLLAALRLGRLARFVPQPVLAGFMNGIALLIVLSQIPALLALPRPLWHAQGLHALPAAHGAALALGLGTAALIMLLARRAPRAPGALLGLLAGVAVFHIARRVWPALNLGSTMGSIEAPHAWPGLLALSTHPQGGLLLLQSHATGIVLTATLLALIGTLESILTMRALDQRHGTRDDETRTLVAMGLANLIGGLAGALPLVMVRARASALVAAGGWGRAGAFGAVVASALLIGAGGEAIAQLPQAVLAGVMLSIAASLVDPWSRRLLLQSLHADAAVRTSLLIVAGVCLFTVWKGPAAGVATGVALSTVVFIRGMNRSLLRARFDGASQPSRRVYPAPLEQVLQAERRRVVVLELEGALFFGSAERVAEEAEGLPPDVRFLVLDLRRVSTIDESAAMTVQQIQARLDRRGVRLLLSGIAPGSAQRQQLQSFLTPAPQDEARTWFHDTDRALEHAELQLLREGSAAVDALGQFVPLSQSLFVRDLSPEQQQTVAAHMMPLQLQAGESLFHAGDPGDGLYVLTQGSVSVLTASGQRFASFSPGTQLGEVSMLDGRGRSANAVADNAAQVQQLTRQALAELAHSDPALAALLYRNMALYLAERLRTASEAWRRAAA